MANLKSVNLSLVGDNGTFDGNGLELVFYLREMAISDCVALLNHQLNIDKDFVDDALEQAESPYLLELQEYEKPAEQEVSDEPVEAIVPQKMAELYDMELSAKLLKYQQVLSYLDTIIKTDGETAQTVNQVLQKFLTLNNVDKHYGVFNVSLGFTEVA